MRCSKCGGLLIRNEETCIRCGKSVGPALIPISTKPTTPRHNIKTKPTDPHIRMVITPGIRTPSGERRLR